MPEGFHMLLHPKGTPGRQNIALALLQKASTFRPQHWHTVKRLGVMYKHIHAFHQAIWIDCL